MVNGFIVAVLKVPAIVATLGTLSIFRGIDYVIAGPDQVPLAGLPEGFTDPARADILGIPVFVADHDRRRRRRDRCSCARRASAARSTRSAATPRRPPSWASRPGCVVFVAFSLCGLLAGLAGVMWVMQFGTINGTAGDGRRRWPIIAAVVVGGVNTLGGSGTLAGAAIGALFLGFIANALILVGLSQFWLQAIYGVVILVAIGSDQLIRRSVQRAQHPERRPMTRHRPESGDRPAAAGRARWPAGRRCSCVALLGLIVMGNALSPFFLTRRQLLEPARRPHGGGDHGPADDPDHHPRRDRPVGRVDGRPGQRRPRASCGRRACRSRSRSRSSSSWAPWAGSSTARSSPAAACRRWSSRWARSPCSGAWR